MKRNDLQHIIYTSVADYINVTINSSYLYIPNLMPSVETQLMFNEATQNIYKISFDKWYTERRLISDLLVQHDIGSAQKLSSPKYLNSARPTSLRKTTPDKKFNIALLHNLDLRKNFVEIDGQTYPRESVLINYEEKDYIQQYKGLKLLSKEYIGELLLNSRISYPEMETKYLIVIIVLRHQTEYITAKTIQLFQEYGTDPDNARLIFLLNGRREIYILSYGNNLIEVKVIHSQIFIDE